MKKDTYRLFSTLETVPYAHKRAEIDMDALCHNYRTLCAHVHTASPHTRPIAVVKADAYGHGAPFCVRALLGVGCDFFAVSCIEEAIAVRHTCNEADKNADVLILGYTDPSLAPLLSEHSLTQTLLSRPYAEALAEQAAACGIRLRTHVAVDTGMGRIGFPARTREELISSTADVAAVAALPALDVCGMFTHFANADANTEKAETATNRQAERYHTLRSELEQHGVMIPFHHVCNSAAAVRRTQDAFDGVRLGILLYGAAPALHAGLDLHPVMRLSADVVHVQTLPVGETVGYGGRFCADGERRIAVLPIGYADGVPRALRGATLTAHTPSGTYPVPVVGNVCMDQCMIDVTDTDADVGTRVTLFGDTPDQLAALSTYAKTIDYELLCAVSARVTREYRTTLLE